MTSTLVAPSAPTGVDDIQAVRPAVLSLYVHDYFYDRFHEAPPRYIPDRFRPLSVREAGMVVADQAQQFNVWNALSHLIAADLHRLPENHGVFDQLIGRIEREAAEDDELNAGKLDIDKLRGMSSEEAKRGGVYEIRSAIRKAAGPTCDLPITEVRVDSDTLVTTIEVTINNIRGRRKREMAYLINPIFWEDYHPGFVQAYQCPDIRGLDLRDADPPRATEEKNPTRRWSGNFFEEVALSDPYDAGVLCEFKNVLEVTYTGLPREQANRFGQASGGMPHPLEIGMTFDLRRSLSTRLGMERLGPGIDVDDGSAIASMHRENGEEVWNWTARKRLRFVDLTPNTIVTSAFDFGQWLNFLTPAFAGASLSDSMHAAALREPPFDTLDPEKLKAKGKWT